MLYRRTPELPPLRKISNGIIDKPIFPDESSQDVIPAGELFLKALWFEVSLTKDEDCNLPAAGPDNARTIVSRKYNVDEAFRNNLNEISAKYAKIIDLKSDYISSDYISTEVVIADVISTNNITADYGDIDILSSDDISTDFLSVDNGKIDNISGDNIVYDNGWIGELSSQNIHTTNITATGRAELSAAATFWADLAELYKSNDIFDPGTLVRFNGENEIEIASDGIANGVISKNPALLMNSSIKNIGYSNPLILVGRSVVKITGKIEKFDRIELSDIPGVAQKSRNKDRRVLGISLESKSKEEIEPIECIVKLTI